MTAEPRTSSEPTSLPEITAPLGPAVIMQRLTTASRRGRLAGFQSEKPPGLFSVEAFAAPFEHKLVATAAPTSAGTTLTFRTHVLPKVPAIFIVAIIISIWPGVWMTHSMLVTWFSWYSPKEWVTWAWYIPLTVVPLPWYLLKSWRTSRAMAHADGLAQIERIRAELAGGA